jgi:hypothetical protein
VDQILRDKGHVGIPMRRLKPGYLGVEIKLDGVPLFLIVDTGTVNTFLDKDRSKKLGWQWRDTGEGRANVMHVRSTVLDHPTPVPVVFGEYKTPPVVISAMDLSSLTGALIEWGEDRCDGVLGADVLGPHAAVIDYSSLTLYLSDLKPVK